MEHDNFVALKAQGDEKRRQAESASSLAYLQHGDYRDQHEDQLIYLKQALEYYEQAYTAMDDTYSPAAKSEFESTLNKLYEDINWVEHCLYCTPFEQTRNPRKNIPKAAPRPENRLAPATISPDLAEMDDWLQYGESPPLELLKTAMANIAPKVTGGRLVTACALLDDKKRFEQLVYDNYFRDKDAYVAQKDSGVGVEDLGAKPSYFVSARRLRELAEYYLYNWQSELVDKICDWLKQQGDAR